MLHLNATAYGGGVAELLATHVALLRDVGIDAEWHVIHGSDEFFAVTKTVHNALQGADVEWTPQMEHIYLERVLDNALQLEGDWDFVVIHDPQPAAIRDYARGHGVAPDEHEVDLALPHRPHRREPAGLRVLPTVRRAVRRVGVDDAAVRPRLDARWIASSSRRRASIRCR